MAFRDDREVLKQKARDLEQMLAEANSKLDAQASEAARAKQLESELAAARATLERIEAQLPKPAGRSKLPLLLGAGVVLAVGGAAFLVMRPTEPAPVPPPPMEVQPARPQLPLVTKPVETAAPIAPVATPTPIGEPIKEVNARWVGKAKMVTGAPIKVGAACSVDAVLRSHSTHEVTISCGKEVLYASTDRLEGMAQLSNNADETPAQKPGTAQASLVWSDIGARSEARAQASVNSPARVAAAWRDTSPSYRVEVEIPELSTAYEGAFHPRHSHENLPFQERVEASAKVMRTGGRAPVQVGSACRVSLYPQWIGGLNCRAKVTCGNRVLYGIGSTGFGGCEVADGKVAAFNDNRHEGDPVLNWDVPRGTIALVVQEGDAEWNADFSVAAEK